MKRDLVVIINGAGTNGAELKGLYKHLAKNENYFVYYPGFLPGGFTGDYFPRATTVDFIEFIEETHPDWYRAQRWYAYPATPVWNQKDQYKIEGASFNWSHYTMDYKTACDIVEKIFLSIETSMWLPLYGFYHWGLFYLLRRGMTMAQAENFIKRFDAVMRDKFLNPDRKNIGRILLENLKKSCLFDAPAESERVATLEEMAML